jgi:hypothetical protein
MAKPGQMPVQGDPEYGDQAALAEAQAAVPAQETPLTEPVVPQDGTVSETGNPAVAGNTPMPMPVFARSGPSRFTGRAQNLLRLPPEVLMPDSRAMTPIERSYTAGVLWDVLAQDPSASPIIKYIANELKGTS